MNYDDSKNCAVRTGIKLICYGNECVIQELATSNGCLYARLSFSCVNKHKTGTDGWYSVGHLLRDENVIFVDSEKAEEYEQVYRDLSRILYTLGSKREVKEGDADADYHVPLADEELGRKIREFCTTYGTGGSISCEGLVRIILTSSRNCSLIDNVNPIWAQDVIMEEALSGAVCDAAFSETEENADKEAQPFSYISPFGFANCIDTIFSNYLGRIAEYHKVDIDRDNITVDMMMEWLKSPDNYIADRFGFLGFNTKNH